jgi:hypothetical protein
MLALMRVRSAREDNDPSNATKFCALRFRIAGTAPPSVALHLHNIERWDKMSFSASSFAAGVGSVVVMVGVGFGAGLMMTGAFDEPREPNKLERRLAEAADVRVDSADPKTQPSQQQPQSVGQAPAQEVRPPAPRETQSSVATNVMTIPPPPQNAPAPVVQPAPAADNTNAQASDSQTKAQERAQERAQDIAARQEIAAKKLAERKRAERRRVQAERRRQREQDLDAVAEWVRRQPMESGIERPRYAGPGYYVTD